MGNTDKYIQAATRENTRKSYQAAIEHFEIIWGGFLPATADNVASYLADFASTLAISTLRQRLAAISVWHTEQGFPDPTKSPHVKKVLKGIAALHPHKQKQAKPLQIQQLSDIIQWIERALLVDDGRPHRNKLLRDRAIFLIGFWRAFRSDELARMQCENVDIIPGEGMTIYIPSSKTDRSSSGRNFKAPVLHQLCPVLAYQEWIDAAQLSTGPVFPKINQWGHIASNSLHPASIIAVIKQYCELADIPDAQAFSSHSLRRGFANWANSNDWDTKTLMEYVGWKDVKSAMRYIESTDPFSQQRIELGLSTLQKTEMPDRLEKPYD